MVSSTMFWNTLVIIATLAGLAAVVLVIARRWAEAALIRIDRIERAQEDAHAELTEASTFLRLRTEALHDRIERLESAVNRRSDLTERLVRTQSSKIVASTRKSVAKDLATTFGQLEALQNLYAIASPGRPVPASRNWAASPDLLLLLVSLVERRRPGLIVECGSGLSTFWFATALDTYGVDGRVVALEHDAAFAEHTRNVLATHELDRNVEIRDAGLVDFRLDDQTFSWYDRAAWSDLEGIDLLFVDGPPTDTGPLARYPALPLLSTRLADDPAVVLDDMIRPEEQETLQRWLDDDPAYHVEHARLEKKAAILTRPTPADVPDPVPDPSHPESPQDAAPAG